MTAVLIAGLGVGAGLVGIIHALFPAPETLSSRLSRLEVSRSSARANYLGGARDGSAGGDSSTARLRALRYRWAQTMYVEVSSRTSLLDRFTADLEVAGVDGPSFVFDMAAGALVGATLLPALLIAASAVHIHIPIAIPAVGIAVLGAGGALIAPAELSAKARRRRAEFAWVLASYLGLVSTSLAGGMAIEEALTSAAQVGQSWALVSIRAALAQGVIRSMTPWESLAALGTRFGVSYLGSLVRSVRLAGSEGARVKASIAQRARSISGRLMTEAREKAAATNERLFLASVVCLGGFLVLLLYPALSGLAKL